MTTLLDLWVHLMAQFWKACLQLREKKSGVDSIIFFKLAYNLLEKSWFERVIVAHLVSALS
jgi:hypothetical protein